MNTTPKTSKLNHPAIAYSVATVSVAFAATVGALSMATDANLTPSSPPAATPTHSTLISCLTEDSDNCIWVSDEHGGEPGSSFIRYNSIQYVDSAALTASQSCAQQLQAWTLDATVLLSDLTGQWAKGATFGEYVITDNLQPMNDRLTYLKESYCQ